MPVKESTPQMVRPYLFHGADLSVRGDEAVGDCPSCGRKGKFSVNTTTGLAHCVHADCGVSWNVATFLRWLVEDGGYDEAGADDLAADRGLLTGQTVTAFGGVRSPLTDEWLFPGYGSGGKVDQVYRYTEVRAGGRKVMMATPGVGHGMFYAHGEWDESAEEVLVCEGPWDGMAVWEVADGANVVAVPSCSVFDPHWCPLFAGKVVKFLYDSDHPRQDRQGREMPPAGLAGVRHACEVLAAAKDRPKEVRYLRWGPDGYDPSQKSGYDLRDVLLEAGDSVEARRSALIGLIAERVAPVPKEWSGPRKAVAVTEHAKKSLPKKCTSWRTLVDAWRRALTWTDGLDRSLAVMLASCASVRLVGDQLWVKVIGPPGCGKSTLCEALAVSGHVHSVSVLRGFHSGYDATGRGDQDSSLVVKISDKTLVIKDGDALLTQPNKEQTLAEARDIYDRVSRTHYRNKMSREYTNVNMTMILCGTASLRQLDSSELGERFLNTRIMVDDIDAEQEDLINDRSLNSLRQTMRVNPEVNGTVVRPAEEEARLLTGGYVDHLRASIGDEIRHVEMSDDAAETVKHLGKFVAYMRTRESKTQKEEVNRELSTRLVNQLGRLAYCLAVVTNKRTTDDDVMRRVRLVALETSYGRTYDLAKVLARKLSVPGTTAAEAALLTGEDDDDCRALLRFLRKIGAARAEKGTGVFKGTTYWTLTTALAKLWEEVHRA